MTAGCSVIQINKQGKETPVEPRKRNASGANTRIQINKQGKETPVEPSAFKTAGLFTVPGEQLGYIIRCFASISA